MFGTTGRIAVSAATAGDGTSVPGFRRSAVVVCDPSVSTLFSVFEDTVRRVGDRVAVEVQRKDGLDRFTYRDLHALVLNRAAGLKAAGVQPGDRCAILAHNDAHWCAAYLAILARGAIVVPFDTNYSAAQVATILRDSGARVLFAGERLEATATEALAELPDVTRLDVHAPADAVSDADANAAADAGRALDGGAPAVILYTSGTTSDPKGVVLSHANLIAERYSAFAVVNVSENDSVLGVLPLFHSLAQLANLLLPFAVGARVVYLETLSSQELVRALSERADHDLRVRAAVLLSHPRAHHARGGEARRAGGHHLQGDAGGELPRPPHGREPRAHALSHGAPADGPPDAPVRDRRLEVRPGDRPRSLLARLHHPPGLRPDRDQRRLHHQHAARSAHRYRRPPAAGHRDQDPAAGSHGGRRRRRGSRDSWSVGDAGVLQPARRHRRGDAGRLVPDRAISAASMPPAA